MIGIDTGVLVAWELPEHPECSRIRGLLTRETATGNQFVIAPQVFSEFIHIVSDPRRFSSPLDIEAAVNRAEWWQSSSDVIVPTVNAQTFATFFDWMRQFKLGRKRVLDTLLAATYSAHGVTKILTLNENDFRLFAQFEFIG